jgi:formylglycine-generating enzyme required for sulfatase activity
MLIEFETPTLDDRGQLLSQRRHTAEQVSVDLAHGAALQLVVIPAGTFQMGSLPTRGNADEQPLHFVAVRSFSMSRGPVTQAQWTAVMGKLPPCRFRADDLPVEQVSWNEARAFCQQLSRNTGRVFRLPSEAEWEYGCRAGTTTPFAYGETLTTDVANYVGEHVFRHEPRGVYRHSTTPPGTFAPNAFGLFDMHGNIWEWCADSWQEDYTSAPRDGTAHVDRRAAHRVARGGSWHEPPDNCRSAARIRFVLEEREQYLGFRVACESADL